MVSIVKLWMAVVATSALASCTGVSVGSGENIHSPDTALRYTLSDANIFASAGGPTVIHGAPVGDASVDEVAADLRLPAYLTPQTVTSVPCGTKGHRLELVFQPLAGTSGRSICSGDVTGGVAGATTQVLAVFCRSENTVLGEAVLEVSGDFSPGRPAFRTAMTRLNRTIMPFRSPFDQGERGCRRIGC